MMKHLKTIIGVVALCAVFACTKSQDAGSGYVDFKVKNNSEVADIRMLLKVHITKDNFMLRQLQKLKKGQA